MTNIITQYTSIEYEGMSFYESKVKPKKHSETRRLTERTIDGLFCSAFTMFLYVSVILYLCSSFFNLTPCLFPFSCPPVSVSKPTS